MSKYYIRLAALTHESLDELFNHFKSNPPQLQAKPCDSHIYMGEYPVQLDDEVHNFDGGVFMVKGGGQIDFYQYRTSYKPMSPKGGGGRAA